MKIGKVILCDKDGILSEEMNLSDEQRRLMSISNPEHKKVNWPMRLQEPMYLLGSVQGIL